MSRPRIRRRICEIPKHLSFSPDSSNGVVNLLVEEYEAIRLIDYKGLTQEECSQIMGISRTSVQKMYEEARYKLTQSLVEGKVLLICGGDYFLCSKNSSCNRKCGRNYSNRK